MEWENQKSRILTHLPWNRLRGISIYLSVSQHSKYSHVFQKYLCSGHESLVILTIIYNRKIKLSYNSKNFKKFSKPYRFMRNLYKSIKKGRPLSFTSVHIIIWKSRNWKKKKNCKTILLFWFVLRKLVFRSNRKKKL